MREQFPEHVTPHPTEALSAVSLQLFAVATGETPPRAEDPRATYERLSAQLAKHEGDDERTRKIEQQLDSIISHDIAVHGKPTLFEDK